MTDERPPQVGGHGLRVIAEEAPPTSGANDFIVVGAAVLAAACGVGFGLGLLLGAPLPLYGSALAVGLIALGVAVRRFITDRYADIEAIEPRPGMDDVQEDVVISDVEALPRRRFLGRVLAAAAGVFGLGLLAPVVSLGPAPGDALRQTAWARGKRLVTTDGEAVAAEELAVGSVLTVWPEDAISEELAAVVLLRLSAAAEAPTNPEWVVDGAIVAYSKVCTHAGCPVSLFREQANALFCPCHQSTFDARRGAAPTFGPAARALPQLPLAVDDEGLLVALGDFDEQVGPVPG